MEVREVDGRREAKASLGGSQKGVGACAVETPPDFVSLYSATQPTKAPINKGRRL